jgi:Zn-dependent peptidase ImmA (M78 family)/DNA-binding XRE family transcriptional regulator
MGKHKTPAEREIALRVGARIRQLREIQHVSQIRLATEIGIRAGPLGWIEKGKHLPSGRVLYRIAKQLNVRLDDLFQETDVWQATAPTACDTAPVLLPPIDVAVSSEPVKASHIVCQSVAEKLIALEELCGAIKTAGLPLTLPFATTESGAEYLAAKVRQKLGVGDAIVYDYLEVFENAGLRVVFLDMPEGCDTFSGYDRVNRNAFFFVNSRLKKQPEHQLFRLVFELGRVYWYTGTLSGSVAAGGSPEEGSLDEAQFARRFAAYFLMPAGAVQSTVWQLGLTPKAWTYEMLLRLKKRYGVSAQSFALRLQGLGLSWCEKQKRSPRHYLFKDEIDAFYEANGPTAEPGGNRPPLAMNGRLCDLLLRADQSAQDPKALNAVKRVLRQSGAKLDA